MTSTPSQITIFVMLAIAGIAFLAAALTGGKKWKRQAEEEAEEYAVYRNDADATIREQTRRIAELERENAQLKSVATAEAPAAVPEAAAVAAPIAAAPVIAPAPEPLPPPAPEPVVAEPEPVASAEPEPTPDAAPEPATAAEVQPVAEVAPESEPVTDPAPEPTVEPAPPAPAAIAAPIALAAAVPAFVAAPDRPEATTPENTATAEATEDTATPGWFSSGEDDLTTLRGLDSALSDKLGELGVKRFEDIEKLSAEDEMALETRLGVPAGYIAREQWRDQAALLRAGQNEEHRARFEAPAA